MTAGRATHMGWVVFVLVVKLRRFQMANVRKFTMNVSGGSLTGSYTVNVEMDFNGLSTDELIEMSLYGRKVALAGVLRKKSDEYVGEIAKQPVVLHARDAGANVVTAAEKADALAKQLGIPVALARKIVDDPTILDKLGK
jgi:hypothetical protein